MRSFWAVGAIAVLLAGVVAGAAGQQGKAGGPCDRACLTGIVDRYLAAMVAHDPAHAPITRNVRYTENTGSLPVGEGLWVGASETPTTFKIHVRRVTIADEERGLVFGLSMFHHKGNVRSIKVVGVPGIDTVPMNFGPIDLEAAHIYKISGGKLHEIEAMGFLLPYNWDSGWDNTK